MKKKLCIVVLAACVSMTGCAASVPELTDTDSEMISQYLAGAVLNHDADYKYGFSYGKSVLKPTPTPEPTPTLVPVQTKNPESKDDRPVNDGTDSVPKVKEVDLASLYVMYLPEGNLPTVPLPHGIFIIIESKYSS